MSTPCRKSQQSSAQAWPARRHAATAGCMHMLLSTAHARNARKGVTGQPVHAPKVAQVWEDVWQVCQGRQVAANHVEVEVAAPGAEQQLVVIAGEAHVATQTCHARMHACLQPAAAVSGLGHGHSQVPHVLPCLVRPVEGAEVQLLRVERQVAPVAAWRHAQQQCTLSCIPPTARGQHVRTDSCRAHGWQHALLTLRRCGWPCEGPS